MVMRDADDELHALPAHRLLLSIDPRVLAVQFAPARQCQNIYLL